MMHVFMCNNNCHNTCLNVWGGGGGSSNGGGHLPHMFHTLNEKLFISHSLSWSYHNHPPMLSVVYIIFYNYLVTSSWHPEHVIIGIFFFWRNIIGVLVVWIDRYFGGNLVSSDLRKIGEAKWTQRTKYITILFGNLFHFISFGKNHLLAWSHHLFNFPFFFWSL